jgi:DNA-binding LytR/AlgR family response regulator
MNILIIEDEQEAVHRLTMFLARYEAEKQESMRILGVIDSVNDAVQWFRTNTAPESKSETSPDLVLMDIHLADGLSFEIFRHVEVNVPIIFTTAYNEYALHAFNVHSIAYLLKPFGYAEFEAALKKLAAQKALFASGLETSNNEGFQQFQETLREVGTAIKEQQKRFKTRFLLNVGENIIIVRTADISYIHAEGKIVTMTLLNGRKYIADNTLDELESLLNPEEFFRISRKFLLRAEAVGGIEPYFNGRLALKLIPAFSEEVLVSRERVKDFRAWLEGS